MSITKAQTTTHLQGTGDPVTLAFGSNVTSGNWLVVRVATYDQDYPVPTDTLGTSYSEIAKLAAGGRKYTSIFYGKAPSSGANTVTVNPVASTDVSIVLDELAGADTTDAKDDTDGAEASGTSSTPSSGNLAATSAADDVLLGMVTHDGANTTISPGADFSTDAEDETVDRMPYSGISRGFGGGLASGTVDAADWTLGASRDWVAVAASFKAAAAVGQDTPELSGRPFGLRGQTQMRQVLAQ